MGENFQRLIGDKLKELGESWDTVELVTVEGQDHQRWDDEEKDTGGLTVLTSSEAQAFLDYEVDSLYDRDSVGFYVWTPNYILVKAQDETDHWVEGIPRNPDKSTVPKPVGYEG